MQKKIATPGRGILAMDESNATCGKRLDSIGVSNTEDNRRAYRELLVSAPGLGQFVSGAILFEETLYQSTAAGKRMVDVLNEQVGISSFSPKINRTRTSRLRPVRCTLTAFASASGRSENARAM